MSDRHRAREIALQFIYQYSLKNISHSETAPQNSHLLQELNNYFEHFKTRQGLREFITQLVLGTLSQIEELDSRIEKHTLHWKIDRISPIDRSILRMAAYELSGTPASPPAVVINEAVKLAKSFGDIKTPAFVNGILDSLAQDK